MQRRVHPNIDAEENKTELDLTPLVSSCVIQSTSIIRFKKTTFKKVISFLIFAPFFNKLESDPFFYLFPVFNFVSFDFNVASIPVWLNPINISVFY